MFDVVGRLTRLPVPPARVCAHVWSAGELARVMPEMFQANMGQISGMLHNFLGHADADVQVAAAMAWGYFVEVSGAGAEGPGCP
jgi:hypothetical protein